MVLNIWNDIGNVLSEVANKIKDFFVNNSHNAIVWVGIIVACLLLFEIVYKA